jgi:hypothetical protein
VNEITINVSGHVTAKPVRVDHEKGAFTLLGVSVLENIRVSREESQHVITTVWFVAEGGFGKDLLISLDKGDRVVIGGHIRKSDYADNKRFGEENCAFVATAHLIATGYTAFLGTDVPIP